MAGLSTVRVLPVLPWAWRIHYRKAGQKKEETGARKRPLQGDWITTHG